MAAGDIISVTAQGSGEAISQPASATVIEATTKLTGAAINGTPQVGDTLAASLTPSNAAVSYEWQESYFQNGAYTVISGATSSTYTLAAGDVGNCLEVVATLATTDSTYTAGSATSAAAGPVTIPLTAIGGTGVQLNDGAVTLTVGMLTPSSATASYQWLESTDGGVSYTPTGVTSSTYATGLNINDFGATYNFKVVATGTGNYSGTVTSLPLSF
jgi:predicted membrane-bound mannosyltransferase